MNCLRRSGRWVALIAAYAVALQALLPAAIAVAAPAQFSLCATLTPVSGGKALPDGGHAAHPDRCAVICGGPALAEPPEPPTHCASQAPAAEVSAVVLTGPALPFVRGPQSPRAPPVL